MPTASGLGADLREPEPVLVRAQLPREPQLVGLAVARGLVLVRVRPPVLASRAGLVAEPELAPGPQERELPARQELAQRPELVPVLARPLALPRALVALAYRAAAARAGRVPRMSIP